MSLEDLAALVPDGATVAFSGAVLRGKPVAAARALAGKRDLELIAFTGSLEVELLLAAGALRSVTSSYVGLGTHGAARGFGRAVAPGAIDDRELSEWMLVGGLRAATMGIPFLPTRAALGSQLVEERGFRTVVDPYGGERVPGSPAAPSGCRDRPRLAGRRGRQRAVPVAAGPPRRRGRARRAGLDGSRS